MTDEYQILAAELHDLVNAWQNAKWWQRGSYAKIITIKVWYRMPLIYSALLHHTEGMKAQRS